MIFIFREADNSLQEKWELIGVNREGDPTLWPPGMWVFLHQSLHLRQMCIIQNGFANNLQNAGHPQKVYSACKIHCPNPEGSPFLLHSIAILTNFRTLSRKSKYVYETNKLRVSSLGNYHGNQSKDEQKEVGYFKWRG